MGMFTTLAANNLRENGISGYKEYKDGFSFNDPFNYRKGNNYNQPSTFATKPVLGQTPTPQTQSVFSNVLGENSNYGGYKSVNYGANSYGKANLQTYSEAPLKTGPKDPPKPKIKSVPKDEGWMANFNNILFGEKDAKGNRDVGLADYGKGALGVWDMYNGYQANKMLEDRIDMEREKQALDVEGAGMGYNNDVVHQQVIARQMDGTAANAAEARKQLAKDQVWQEGNLVRTSVADKKKRKSSLKV